MDFIKTNKTANAMREKGTDKTHCLEYLPKDDKVASPCRAEIGLKLQKLGVLGWIVGERDNFVG